VEGAQTRPDLDVWADTETSATFVLAGLTGLIRVVMWTFFVTAT
jgi:hypothetical protein